MSKIIIADGKTSKILDHIHKYDVSDNDHDRDMSNWVETFEFTAFADKRYAQHLVDRNRLIIPDEDGKYRELIIKKTERYSDDDGVNYIHIISLGFHQELITAKKIDPGTTASQSPEAHMRDILAGTEVRVGEVAYTGNIRTITRENPTDPFSALKILANTFDLELDFRIEVDRGTITRYADLVEHIGDWRGRTVEFGHDLQSVNRITDANDIVTALHVYGPEREDGTRLEVFVEDEDARNRWSRNGEHLVKVYEPETEDQDITEERLRTLGRTELNKRVNALVTWEINVIDLEHVPGMQNKKIRYGDTIRVKDTTFNPPFYVEARIFKQRRNIFHPGSKEVELGDFIEYTVEEVRSNWEKLREELEKKIDEAEERAKIRGGINSKIVAIMPLSALKSSIDSQYNEIIDNPDLSSTIRGQLTVAKFSYDVSYDSLMTTVEAKDKLDNPTESDVEEVYGLLGSYESELANISELLEKATESISKNYTDDHIDEVNRELDEASRRIDDAKDDIERARGDLDIARDELDQTKIDLNDSRERLEDAEGNLRDARDDLNKLESDLREAEEGLRDKVDFVDYNARIDELVGDISNKVDELDYNRKIVEITSDIAAKVDGEWVDDRLRVELDKINFDSRNYLLNTSTKPLTLNNPNSPGTERVNGIAVSPSFLESAKGKEVTISVEGRSTGYERSGDSSWVGVETTYQNADGEVKYITVQLRTRLDKDGQWRIYSNTVLIPGDAINIRESVTFLIRNIKGFVELRQPVLNIGDNGKPWEPAPEDILDGLESKADSHNVYIKADVDDMFDKTVSLTAYETDQEGYVERFRDYESNVNLTWEAINASLSKTDYNRDQGLLEDRLTNWEATADGIEQSVSRVRTDLDNLEIGGGNLASLDALYHSGSGITRDGYVFTLESNGSGGLGVGIRNEIFEINKDYVLSFKIKKLSGDIERIAGHSFAFEVTKGVFIDGEEIGDSFGNDVNPFPNDNEEHEIVIYFNYDNPNYDGGLQFVIQPNRPGYGLAYKAEIWDLMVVEGNKMAKGWQPAPEDTLGRIESLSGRLNVFAGRIEAMVEREELVNYVDKTTYTREYGELITEFGKISGKVEDVESDLDTATGDIFNITEQVGQLVIESDNITTSVSKLRGDFDGLQIGGTNLNRDSNNFSRNVLTPYDNSIVVVTENISVDEWGATDATQIRASEGVSTSLLKVYKHITSTTDTVLGETYTVSFYVKNLRDRPMSVNVNGLTPRPTVDLEPNEARRVVVTGERSTNGLQLQFWSSGYGFYTEFAVWRAQVEEGNKVTPWSPAPEDNITYTETRIEQLAEEIGLYYIKNDELITGINLSEEGVRIDGDKLLINGDTTINGDIGANGAKFIGLATEELYAFDAEIEDSKITGKLDANEALFQKGKFEEAHLVEALIEEADIIDADIRNATITGSLNSVGGTFTGTLSGVDGTFTGRLSAASGTFKGDLQAAGGTFSGNLSAAGGTFSGRLSAATGTFRGSMTAGSITSDTTIDVTTNARIGNSLSLGRDVIGENTIEFYRGSTKVGEISGRRETLFGYNIMSISNATYGGAGIDLIDDYVELDASMVYIGRGTASIVSRGNHTVTGGLSAEKLETTDGASLGTSGSYTYLRPAGNSNHSIRLTNSSGYVAFLVNGSVTHAFRTDGTKIGGTIDIDGERYGMSPIDSPQILLSVLLTDIEVKAGQKTEIQLNAEFAKAIKNMAIFPSHPVRITKGDGRFSVTADESLTVDFMVYGERTGYEGTFWLDIEEEIA